MIDMPTGYDSPQELDSYVRSMRRLFHQYPEPGWCEYRTTLTLARELEGMGLAVRLGEECLDVAGRVGLPSSSLRERFLSAAGGPSGLAERMGQGTGLIADVCPGLPPGICVRCDIDALPVAESSADDHGPATGGFISRNPGYSHACGHDGHMAIALGALRILSERKDALVRNVRFVFQPAEEGVRGACSLVGAVSGYPLFLGYHIGLSCEETGTLVTGVSGFFATSKFDVELAGREAHAAQAPETGADALKGAAEILLALHAMPRDSRGEGRVSVGVLSGGTARNIVPGHAHLECEVRGRPSQVNAALLAGARRIVEHVAAMNGLDAKFVLRGQAESAESDRSLALELADIARTMSGGPAFRAVRESGTVAVSEDAATLMRAVQEGGGRAAYLLVGSRLEAGHHHPEFDFDEQVLAPAARFLADAALHYAGQACF